MNLFILEIYRSSILAIHFQRDFSNTNKCDEVLIDKRKERPSYTLRKDLKEIRVIFKESISKLKQTKIVIFYIDNTAFSYFIIYLDEYR